MKGTHQVLPGRQVDRDLAADAAVDLREQGGGHLDEIQSPQIGCGHETGQIADDPAPERQHDISPVERGCHRALVEPTGLIQGFVLLAVRDQGLTGLESRPGQAGQHRLQVPSGHRRVGDDQDVSAPAELGQGGSHPA